MTRRFGFDPSPRRAGLDELDVDLLLVALAPDLDSRFERLYGYLNDDVTRRRATIGLSLELCGASAWSAAARSRFSPDAPLTSGGLVLVEEPDRPFLSRSLRVPDRVAAHLLGDDRADPAVTPLIRPPVKLPTAGVSAALGAVLAGGVRLVYLRERPGGIGTRHRPPAPLEAAGLAALTVDLDHLNPSEEPAAVARTVGREALLAWPAWSPARSRHCSTGRRARCGPSPGCRGPVLLHGRASWEPAWSRAVPLVVDTFTGSSRRTPGAMGSEPRRGRPSPTWARRT